MVNDKLLESITLFKSIRQGYPLAPYLFVLSADDLRNLLEARMKAGGLRGISIPGGTLQMILLLQSK